VGEFSCATDHAVMIALGLRAASLKNGNISTIQQRLSVISPLDCANSHGIDGSELDNEIPVHLSVVTSPISSAQLPRSVIIFGKTRPRATGGQQFHPANVLAR
jgi:hypothetical protein